MKNTHKSQFEVGQTVITNKGTGTIHSLFTIGPESHPIPSMTVCIDGKLIGFLASTVRLPDHLTIDPAPFMPTQKRIDQIKTDIAGLKTDRAQSQIPDEKAALSQQIEELNQRIRRITQIRNNILAQAQ